MPSSIVNAALVRSTPWWTPRMTPSPSIRVSKGAALILWAVSYTHLDVYKRQEQEALKIEQILRQHPAVTDLFTTIGSTGAPEKLDFFAKLNSDAPSRGVIEQVRAAMANAPGLSFSAGAGIGGAATDISVEVRGLATTSYEALGAEAAQVMKQLETIPGIVDLKSSFKPGRPEIRFIIDRQKAAELGLSTAQIGSTIRTLVNGQVVTTYRGDEDEVDITVQLDGACLLYTSRCV